MRIAPRPSARRARLHLEQLESRLVPYSLTGNAWPNPGLVTLSFVPDGTVLGTNGNSYVGSNMFSKFNAHPGWTTATWEDQIIKAAQTWAEVAGVNLQVVPDSGAPVGSGNYQQGDPTMGDIRIGGFAFNNNYLASAFLPPPVNNYSLAGDISFNTGMNFNIGSTYDLYSVALHEFGHAFGLGHTTAPGAVMYPTYHGVQTLGLTADDVNGIQAIYGPRQPDQFNVNGLSNTTILTAANLTGMLDPNALTEVQNNLDITSVLAPEYFSVTAPQGTSSTFQLTVQTAGLSLLRQAVTVYAADGLTVLGSASSAGAYNGTTQTITLTGVMPGELFYIRVGGADLTAFGTGDYAMTLNFGSGPNPAVTLPNTETLNGSPLQGGGSENERAPSLASFFASPLGALLGNVLTSVSLPGQDFLTVAHAKAHGHAHAAHGHAASHPATHAAHHGVASAHTQALLDGVFADLFAETEHVDKSPAHHGGHKAH